MSNPVDDPGHGHSPAAWTAVVIMLVAVSLGTLFFVLDIPALVWASVGLLVVGALSGWVLAKAGYGVAGPKYKPKQH
ncbi:MAG: HGxxPAAW family protein [Microbacterium sp.]